MFNLSVQNMSNEKQYQKWVPLIKNFKIMGAYGQTEMGHGSDIQGIDTTATFDMETDEFVIHSPTLTSTKWWPGDISHFSSHTIVFAKMIINGKSYGVLPFLAQIRDLDTWMPMKGVELGDMGPKMGYNSKNNGFCRFSHVRIPRDQLL
mmetsp:Transcript_18121/g.30955  ORF Transcript_18121/g.30955 Transcript_18121/m.30955 type:complete len:149 (+) Transcript_18121:409-855(+)